MNCHYSGRVSEKVNQCSLGFYGGRPSEGVCKMCVDRGENSPDYAEVVKARFKVTPPSLMQKAASLATSTAQWASQGFPVAAEAVLADRLAICKGCELWDAEGFGGTGKCLKCGCSTAAKLRMATASCPEGKW